MATSGSTDYSRTAAQIITLAHKFLAVIGAGDSESTNEQTDALEMLNLMIKQWAVQGHKLWLQTEGIIFPVDSQGEYSLPGANGCKLTELSETTLSAAEASGQTVISVTSSSGMTAADVVGIVMDDDTIHWSTIASVDSSTQITIDGATDAAAASGNAVYAYTNAIARPNRIISIRRRIDGNDVEMFQSSHNEYFNLPNKTSEGGPNNWYYDPQLTTGKLYVWPEPSTVDYLFMVTYMRQVEDFDATTNDPDFPQEWLLALAANLAIHLAPSFGKTISQELAGIAASGFNVLFGNDIDEASVIFR